MENLGKDLLAMQIGSQPLTPASKTLLTQLSEAINSAGDTVCLIGPVMKLLPHHNVQVKKTIHGVLPRLCKKHPQAAVLAANSVQQDCADLNPVVKCLGITSLACIPELAEHAPSVLLTLLGDGHPRVRLAAVHGCKAFHGHASLAEHGLVDALYAAVRDQDPQVSTAALLTLDAVLAAEGGVIVTKAMAKHLLRRLSSFAAPQLASVLQALAKYKPKDETELFEELSLLDPYLVYSSCAAVSINCVCLFLTLINNDYTDLIPALVQRSSPALIEYLTASENSALYVLDFLNSELAHAWFTPALTSKLVPLDSDNVKVKIKKLFLLPRACVYNKSHTQEILVAVTPWCKDQSCAQQAIQCVCLIRAKFPEVAATCLDIVLDLLSSNQAKCTIEAMEEFSLDGLSESEVARLLERVVDSLDLLQPHTLPSILPRLLGLYGELLPTSPYILEHMVNCLSDLQTSTKNHLLEALLRMFLKEPAQCQSALGRLLCEYASSQDTELSEKAKRYYSLLVQDPELIRHLLLPQNTKYLDHDQDFSWKTEILN